MFQFSNPLPSDETAAVQQTWAAIQQMQINLSMANPLPNYQSMPNGRAWRKTRIAGRRLIKKMAATAYFQDYYKPDDQLIWDGWQAYMGGIADFYGDVFTGSPYAS
jgi:hypothetical protein